MRCRIVVEVPENAREIRTKVQRIELKTAGDVASRPLGPTAESNGTRRTVLCPTLNCKHGTGVIHNGQVGLAKFRKRLRSGPPIDVDNCSATDCQKRHLYAGRYRGPGQAINVPATTLVALHSNNWLVEFDFTDDKPTLAELLLVVVDDAGRNVQEGNSARIVTPG